MPRMLAGSLLLLAGCCSLPPEIRDRTSAVRAYETFRSEMARNRPSREFALLSERLQRRLGLSSRADWMDMRTVVVTQDHLLVRAIRCSEVGETRPIGPDRTELELRLPLGRRARVVMRRIPVVRAWVEGQEEPLVYHVLDRMRVDVVPRTPDGPGGLLAPLPEEIVGFVLEDLQDLGAPLVRLEAGRIWFLDDFETGAETPEKVREDFERPERPDEAAERES